MRVKELQDRLDKMCEQAEKCDYCEQCDEVVMWLVKEMMTFVKTLWTTHKNIMTMKHIQ